MVLQRNAEVRIWGWADETVSVSFLGRTEIAKPDVEGNWVVKFSDLWVGGPFQMNVNNITLTDVYVGDVWLCSGQSNMEFPMARCKHMYPEEMSRETEYMKYIRQFTVPMRQEFKAPLDDPQGEWIGAGKDTIDNFSAAGYFFASRMFERYMIPIGLLLCAIGGTRVHTWMSRGSLEDYPELAAEADKYADDAVLLAAQTEELEVTEAFFKGLDERDLGLAENWFSEDYADAEWDSRDLLQPWKGTGSTWFRKTVEIPPEWDGKEAVLFLGSVKDWDMVYVNGIPVGNTTYRWPPREYDIPKLKAGGCVIAARIISIGDGWFTRNKQYLLSTHEGSIDLNGQWKFRIGATAAPPKETVRSYYLPVCLYNGMLHPLRNYVIKGALWYQGESDADNLPRGYADKFEIMVNTWRKDWGYDFPVVFTQLAHWGEGDWDALREQQRLCLRIPNTAMAAAFDLGEDNDLHPQNKQPIGDRLARCAMRLAYGEELPLSPNEILGVRKRG
jgi:sialate O-acetylesterase